MDFSELICQISATSSLLHKKPIYQKKIYNKNPTGNKINKKFTLT